MDHSTHHADMNHGDMDHGDMDMGGKCSMNMLFTWSFKNLCIVFPRWHITGVATLIISLLVIVLLSACYEAVRNLARRYEVSFAQRLKAYMGPAAADGEIADESASAAPAATDAPINDVSRRNETSSQLIVGRDGKKALERKGRVTLAALYAVQVFYSFFYYAPFHDI